MVNSKRILIVHRYFFPDTPAYAVILKKMAEKWVENGYEVDVLTSFPSYYGSSNEDVKKNEIYKGVNINRIKLLPEKNRNLFFRLLNTLIFALLVFFKIVFRKKYHLVTVATTPPILMATIVRWSSYFKGHKFLYHCQDIYPEIAYYNKDIKSKLFFNFLRFIDKKNNKKASIIVVLSNDMKNTLVNERNIDPHKIKIINNFIRENKNKAVTYNFSYKNCSSNDFRIVFCGNIGKLQNLDKIIEIAKNLEEHPNIKFIFIGSGIEVNKLKIQSGKLLNDKIHFLGYLNSDVAVSALKQADVGIISISEPTYKTAYPSKTMTYLKVGLPVLAIVNNQSEIGNFISKNQLGLIANPNDIEEIKGIIIKLFKTKSTFDNAKIKDIAFKEFGEAIILEKWVHLLKSL